MRRLSISTSALVVAMGFGCSSAALDTAAREIKRWIDVRLKQYVCVTSVHGIIDSHSDPVLRTIHNSAGMVTPDGMPLVWLSRLSGKSGVSRVYGPELMLDHGSGRRSGSRALGTGIGCGPTHC